MYLLSNRSFTIIAYQFCKLANIFAYSYMLDKSKCCLWKDYLGRLSKGILANS